MQDYHGHTLPDCNQDVLDDTLFHYTNANGLIGIVQNNEIWCTASYCSNDETELAVGKKMISQELVHFTSTLVASNDSLVKAHHDRGVNICNASDDFVNLVIETIFRQFCVYVSCFFRPSTRTHFYDGLLSQWRGYGDDGGYAIQFSRKKLTDQISLANQNSQSGYNINNVDYSKDNVKLNELKQHMGAFNQAFNAHLKFLAQPITFENRTIDSPLKGLGKQPIEALLDYLVYTKNEHFSEECECRIARIRAIDSEVDYFNRRGQIVPYLKTNRNNFDIRNCIDAIIVGPNPRMDARLRSTNQLKRSNGMNVLVRPSRIPFTRV